MHICCTGAEEEAAGLLGDVAVSRLQQQQQHLHWELRTQTSAPAALCIDHFDTGNGSHSQLRSSFSNAGSPKHSRFSSVILGDDTSSCVNSGGPGSGAISVSGFTDYGSNSLAFVTPTAGSSQVTSYHDMTLMFTFFTYIALNSYYSMIINMYMHLELV